MAVGFRDGNGQLIAHETEPGCGFGELLAVKIDGRMARIESNVGDARIEIAEIREHQKSAAEQVSGICGLVRELQNEVRIYSQLQTAAKIPDRVVALETNAAVIARIAKITVVVLGLVFSTVGIIIAL